MRSFSKFVFVFVFVVLEVFVEYDVSFTSIVLKINTDPTTMPDLTLDPAVSFERALSIFSTEHVTGMFRLIGRIIFPPSRTIIKFLQIFCSFVNCGK